MQVQGRGDDGRGGVVLALEEVELGGRQPVAGKVPDQLPPVPLRHGAPPPSEPAVDVELPGQAVQHCSLPLQGQSLLQGAALFALGLGCAALGWGLAGVLLEDGL